MDSILGKKLDGRYEIQEIIGIGGMAVVYKAYDSIDDRIVAVKVLKEEYLKNDEFRRRFKNESKAVAVLSHPNIVKVYDVSFGDRIQYIVMEYIDGITLKEYIERQKTLTWKEAVHFTVQILRALSHAHERGIVHRDIKPQNIMMLEDGTIKVTDFGIARFAHSETKTMTDKAIGSVHYISPEQARGSMTDEKSDIYSVGVMLYEMLTGDLPFEADSAVSVAIMQMQENPRQPRELNPEIPEGLEDITLHAMQKDPMRRYRSASEMLDDIERFKRNPSIHFQYKYFVDDSPTKYVEAVKDIKGPDKASTSAAPEKRQEIDKKSAGKKTNMLPILAGITAALVVVVAVVIILALINSGFWIRTPDVTVPNLVNQKFTDMQQKYKDSLDIVQNNTAWSDSIAAGKIISQSLEKDTTVKKNAEITVVVSKGAQKFPIPTVATDDETTAKNALTDAGFTNVVVSKINDQTAAVGTVIKTNPAEGKMATATQKITLFISAGPVVTTITMDSYIGKIQADAEAALTALNLEVKVETGASDTVKAGYVYDQFPEKGSTTAAGSPVILYVSTGPTVSTPQKVKVPNVKGLSLSAARDQLSSLGLNYNPTYGYSDTVPAQSIINQNIGYGRMVDPGKTITLLISIGPKPTSSAPNVSSSGNTSSDGTSS